MRSRKVLFGLSGTWLLTGARILNGMAAMPLYSKFLQPSTLGAWLLFASLGGFLLFADLGLAVVFSRAMAWHQGLRLEKGKGATDLPPALTSASPQDLLVTVQRAYLLLGLMVFSLGGVVGWFYLGSLELAGTELLQVRQAWLLYAAGVGFVLAASTPNYALQGLGDLGVESSVQALAFGLALAATAWVLFDGGGVRSLAVVFLVQQSVVRLALALLLRQRHPWLFEARGRW